MIDNNDVNVQTNEYDPLREYDGTSISDTTTKKYDKNGKWWYFQFNDSFT